MRLDKACKFPDHIISLFLLYRPVDDSITLYIFGLICSYVVCIFMYVLNQKWRGYSASVVTFVSSEVRDQATTTVERGFTTIRRMLIVALQ